MEAILALEDGTWLSRHGRRRDGEARGEVVFNTSMTGYQEVLTDPSYSGQIVTMTCPEIGNYGVSRRGRRVARRRRWPASSCARSRRSPATGAPRARCATISCANGIVAISDIDTRALTRRLRSGGVMRGVIATGDGLDPEALVERARRDSDDGRLGSGARRDVPSRRSTGRRRIRTSSASSPERPRDAPAEDRRVRLRHEVEHPAPAERARLRRARLSGDDAGGGAAGDASRTACS